MDVPFSGSASPMAFSDDYFSTQALNLEAYDLRGGGSRSSGSLMVDRERQILKEKIREDIIARGNMEREMMLREIMAREERRMLRDEVRRELEMELAMGARYRGGCLIPGATVNVAGRGDTMFGRRSLGFGDACRPEVEFEEGVGLKQDAPHPIFRREVEESTLKLPVMKQKNMEVGEDRLFLEKHGAPLHSKYSGTKMPEIWKSGAFLHNKPSKMKPSGIKRKAASAFGECSSELRSPWAYASNSKAALDEHVQGKLLKTNAKQLAGSTDTVTGGMRVPASTSRAMSNFISKHTNTFQNTGGSSIKTINEKKFHLRCEVCEVNCNSQFMLDEHLGGKRHALQLKMRQEGTATVNSCNSQFMLDEHLAGKGHAHQLKMRQKRKMKPGISAGNVWVRKQKSSDDFEVLKQGSTTTGVKEGQGYTTEVKEGEESVLES